MVSGIGSGVVLSANKSKPGSFLFPVKKAVIQTQLHFTSSPIEKEKLEQEILQVTPTATPTPTPTVAPTETPEKHTDRKDVKGAEFPAITVALTPAPQQRDTSHGQGNDSGKNFQNFFNRHEDENKSGLIFLTNHEF
ncbi:MAG: hypothetical protein KGJ07_09740 [Patescibacteria group bacterium]|nr:hypothetical protein [Patescibacteria group bacterium]